MSSAARARAIWEAEHWRLEALDHLSEAAQRGGRALCERAVRELEWLFNAPRRGSAALLESDELDEARALAAGRRALAELGGLASGVPELGVDAAELARVLEGLEIVSGERAGEGKVTVVDPLALRARRVRALFLCGLQEGVFPASARPEPLLSEEERRRLAETSGLRLEGGRQGDALAAERYALYAAVSRPEELLVLSWHAADDDGAAQARSLFVDDIVDLFEEGLVRRRVCRALGAVDLPAGGRRSPTPLAPLRDEEITRELREHVWSASSLEVWAGCPVKWFVERMLRADDLDPEPEPLARGGLAHAVLKDTLEGLRERTGSARLSGARLRLAKELLREALGTTRGGVPAVGRARAPAGPAPPAGGRPGALSGARRRAGEPAGADVPGAGVRVRGRPAGEASEEGRDPALPVGSADTAGLPALDLGEGLRLRGRIDRVDVATGGGQAVVYDYKGRNAPPAAKWTEQGNVQVALYMRAVEELLGLEAAGGFYQPLSGGDLRARGVLDFESGMEIECVQG